MAHSKSSRLPNAAALWFGPAWGGLLNSAAPAAPPAGLRLSSASFSSAASEELRFTGDAWALNGAAGPSQAVSMLRTSSPFACASAEAAAAAAAVAAAGAGPPLGVAAPPVCFATAFSFKGCDGRFQYT